MEFFGIIWNEVFVRPMTNALLFLAVLLFHNFGLSIIAFTIIVRLATFPLTVRQLKSSKAMAELQPKLQEVQKRFASDRQRLSQETMRLYKEAGVNPVGCLGPMIIQFPIWIALYYAIVKAMRPEPESLVGLSSVLYSWAGAIDNALPLNSHFLGMDLAAMANTNPITQIAMPVLVGVSMWAMQKMSTYPSTDPRTAQTNQMMLWLMPFMFGIFTLNFPNGLALYWVVSNIVGIVIQYFVMGWGGLATLWPRRPVPAPASSLTGQAEELSNDGATDRSERQDRGRSDRNRTKATRRKEG